MPTLSGFELARKINAIDKDTKIILTSAFHITREEFDKVMPSTMVDAFIRKPIRMNKLRDHLIGLLGNYKQGRWSLDSPISCFTTGIGMASMSAILQDSVSVLERLVT